jgi:hypothetical protein
MDFVMFINNYRDGNEGITLMGIKGLRKIESSIKSSLSIFRNIKNIQIS